MAGRHQACRQPQPSSSPGSQDVGMQTQPGSITTAEQAEGGKVLAKPALQDAQETPVQMAAKGIS